MVVEFNYPILGVLIPCILMAFIGYGYTFAILIPRESEEIWNYQLLLASIWTTYALAIFKNPGSPPPNFEPEKDEMRRWCTKCSAYKPERTHHCRQCRKCVLKMDHHCPWTMNCVGHANMPHFIRFLISVIIGTGYTFYQLCLVAADLYRDRYLPSYLISLREIIFTVALLPVDFFVLFSVSILFIRVIWNALEGKTQIETWEDDRVQSLIRRKLVPRVDFPYDIDFYTNLTNAWGHPLLWLWPFGEAPGDGMHFEKNEALDGGAVWPPDHVDQYPPDSQGISMGSESSARQPRTLGYMRARRPGHDSDFYKRDQWQNFEGERISDFGVDLDAEPAAPSFEKSDDDDENKPLGLLASSKQTEHL